MDAQHDDGGHAFPCDASTNLFSRGMTLHDYFAAKFSAAWVVALGQRWKEGGFSDMDMLHEATRRGLEQADAMLKARQA